jgi:uridine kinase
VVLLVGPSGCGKSYLAHWSGLPVVTLDDFYRPATSPGMPHDGDGHVDWERPTSWDDEAAVAALIALCRDGATEVPTYSFLENRAVGTHRVERGDAPTVVAEGLFAADLIVPLRDEGLLADALLLVEGRWRTFVRRLRRDLRERRKSLPFLLRQGWRKTMLEPRVIAHQRALGARPVSQAEAMAVLRELGAPAPEAEPLATHRHEETRRGRELGRLSDTRH